MARFSVRITSLLALALLLVGLPLVSGAPPADPPGVVPGEVLVGLRPGAAELQGVAPSLAELGAVAGVQPQLGACRLRLRAGLSVTEAVRQLRLRPDVLYAEPNH